MTPIKCNACGLDGLHPPETCIAMLRGQLEIQRPVVDAAIRAVKEIDPKNVRRLREAVTKYVSSKKVDPVIEKS